MSTKVPVSRILINGDDVRAGRGVRTRTWSSVASAHNWLAGRGAQVIPAYWPGVTMHPGETHVYKYYFRPRYQALERLWAVTVQCGDAGDSAQMDLAVPASGTNLDFSVGGRNPTTILQTEALSSQSATAGERDLEIHCTGATAFVSTISCVEVPRDSLLTSGSDIGVDNALMLGGSPILIGDGWDGQLDATQDDESLIGRRTSFLQWAVPALEGGATPSPATKFASSTTGTSYLDLFTAGIPMLTRKDRPTHVTGTVTARFYAWVTGGTGDIRLNSSVNGASSAASISSTTPAWSSAITATIDCEDVASADGRQTAATPAYDLVDVQIRKNTSGTLYIAAASVWED